MAKYAKAIFAGIIAGLSAVAAVLVDNASIGDLTDGQWVTVVLASLVAFGGVAGIKNAE
jgi:hypothetical protein